MENPTDREPLINNDQQIQSSHKEEAATEKLALKSQQVTGIRRTTFRKLVCLNILIFLVIGASFAADLVVSQYIYFRQLKKYSPNVTYADATEKPCLNKTGPDNGTQQSFQQDAEKDSAVWNTYFMVVSAIPAILVCLSAGSMSDRFGRKPLFYLGTLSELVRTSLLTATIYWELSLDIMIAAYVCNGILGTRLLFKIASYSSAADISTSGKERTLSIALAETSLSLAIFSVYLSTGYLIQSYGYLLPAFAALIMVVVCLLFEYLVIEETLTAKQSNVFFLQQIIGIVRLFKRNKFKERQKCFILCVVAWYFGFQYLACGSKIDALYLINKPFCMSSSEISDIFTMFQVAGVLSAVEMKFFHMFLTDITISMLGAFSFLSRLIIMAFTSERWHFYIVAASGLACNLPYAAIRGIMSRITDESEQGKLFTCVTVISAVCTLTSGVVFNLIYRETIDEFRGAVYISFAACMVIVLFLLGYLKYYGIDRLISTVNQINGPQESLKPE